MLLGRQGVSVLHWNLDAGVLRLNGRPGRVWRLLLAAQQVHDLLAELVARGAVEKEVDGVVDVHEQLRHRLGQLELGDLPEGVLVLLPESRDDQRHVHGQSGE